MIVGCTSTSFVKTGKTYQPLSVNAEVKVFSAQKPENNTFEEIGIFTVAGGNLQMRIDLARKKAREVGGNGIIIGNEVQKSSTMNTTQYHTATTSSGGHINYSTTGTSTNTWSEQQFVIIKIQ
jgi:hypothetical protein